MNFISIKNSLLTLGVIFCSSVIFAQQGTITVNQDSEISALLKLKKEINIEDEDRDRYKIQIYSGNRTRAESEKNSFDSTFNSWS